MQPAKHCRVEVGNDTIIVTPNGNLGELDYELLSVDMEGVLRILEQQRARNVVVDFRHTELFGSDAIYLLLKVHRSVKERKGRMTFCGLSAGEREVLSLMALDNIWTLCQTQADALEYVNRHTMDILVVDDSEVDRCLIGGLLAANPDYRIAYATSGQDALTRMCQALPDLVISDLVMPEIDGLELVAEVRRRYPLVPVILLTAHGSEAIAYEALERGAASFVPKSRQAERLLETVDRVVARVQAHRSRRRLQDCPANLECTFYLGNDPALICPAVDLIQHNLSALGTGEPMDQVRIGIALEEALYNALYHGNLEITAEELSGARSSGSPTAMHDLLHERQRKRELRDRHIVVDVHITSHAARFVVRDDGQGFDCDKISRVTRDSFADGWNRGTLLMCALMDEVIFTPPGNQVTMIKVP